MVRKREVAVALGFVLLAGCPQLLDDEFEDIPLAPDDLHGAPDAGGAPGVGGSGGGAGHAGNAGDAASGTSGSSSGARPAVVSTNPADGARGVEPDVELTFRFSAPMNTSSVEAAYASDDLPAAQVAFTWSEGDTVLRVRPAASLQVETGSDPATVQPASYAVEITSQAKDKAGNALQATALSFSVVRSITQELDAVRDRDLTGNWRTDGSYGSIYCERVDTTICVGDGASSYRAFVTFDLDPLPGDLFSISAAELSSTVQEVYGVPFSTLGALLLEHIEFSSIGDQAYSAPALSAAKSMSTSATAGERMASDVLSELRADWGTRQRSQFRLSFEAETNSDGVADQIVCDWSSAHLRLTYLAP